MLCVHGIESNYDDTAAVVVANAIAAALNPFARRRYVNGRRRHARAHYTYACIHTYCGDLIAPEWKAQAKVLQYRYVHDLFCRLFPIRFSPP